MTAYVDCTECGGRVPWYYAWLYGPKAMHPGCALDRIDEEGCGASWFPLTRIAQDCREELDIPFIRDAWAALAPQADPSSDGVADQPGVRTGAGIS